MDAPLLVARSGRTLTLTLNRPERRNALSPALVAGLTAAVAAAADDAEVGCIVLRGAGGRFCAGGDLGGEGLADGGVLAREAAARAYADLLDTVVRSPVPVLAAVAGDALGGGLGLAAACHLAIAGDDARFGTPELNLGLFPMVIGPLLARHLPPHVLHAMILLDRRIGADEALRWGFVGEVCPAGSLDARAEALAAQVAARPRGVVGLGLRALAEARELPLTPAMGRMASALALNLLADDAAEGLAAFFGRRPAVWTGR
jgi:enoyl-CoA hydratase/carnithine racemase